MKPLERRTLHKYDRLLVGSSKHRSSLLARPCFAAPPANSRRASSKCGWRSWIPWSPSGCVAGRALISRPWTFSPAPFRVTLRHPWSTSSHHRRCRLSCVASSGMSRTLPSRTRYAQCLACLVIGVAQHLAQFTNQNDLYVTAHCSYPGLKLQVSTLAAAICITWLAWVLTFCVWCVPLADNGHASAREEWQGLVPLALQVPDRSADEGLSMRTSSRGGDAFNSLSSACRSGRVCASRSGTGTSSRRT
jgi:hypothetical protein